MACSPKGGEVADSSDEEGLSNNPQIDLTDQVNEIFETNCLSCHDGAAKGNGNLGNILDTDRLIDGGYIVPGHPQKSGLFRRVSEGTMPPVAKLVGPDIELINQWITKGALSKEVAENRPFVPESALYTNAASDLVENFSEGERANVRYFSLIHLYNAGIPDTEIQVNREAMFKMINSVSRSSKAISPKSIDNFKTLYRIELDKIDWDSSAWDDLTRTYSSLVVPDEGDHLGVLQADTGSKVPVIKGDWFVAHASRAPLYYALLKTPTELEAFEAQLHISTLANIKRKNVIRAGFDDSGPSTENRVIERHETPDGFMWRSYEFETSSGEHDIFKLPLGPKDAGLGSAFSEDGGEFIYTLKNGMLAFAIFGKDKNRINTAPASDDINEIVAGQTCMSCHFKGLIHKKDKVRSKADHIEGVKDIYVKEDDFKSQIEKDSKVYVSALKEAGVDPERKDPVFRVGQKFFLDLSLSQAAAELGVPKQILRDYLDGAGGAIGGIFNNGSISREKFEKNYIQMSQDLVEHIK